MASFSRLAANLAANFVGLRHAYRAGGAASHRSGIVVRADTKLEFNLRGDLSKLDLPALEERIERFFAEHERIKVSLGTVSSVREPFPFIFELNLRSRGPFQAVIFYKINLFILDVEFYWTQRDRLYIINCELKNVLDECRRRLAQRI